MRKVLLGIEGIRPERRALLYTLELASRLGWGVEIFEVINPYPPSVSPSRHAKWKQRIWSIKRFFQDAMVATTFAEAGQRGIARHIWKEAIENLAPFAERLRTLPHRPELILRQGSLVREMVGHIREHTEIIMAIISHREVVALQERGDMEGLKRRMDIPLVFVKR